MEMMRFGDRNLEKKKGGKINKNNTINYCYDTEEF